LGKNVSLDPVGELGEFGDEEGKKPDTPERTIRVKAAHE